MNVTSATIGSNWFLNGLATLQRQEEKTQRDLSSGFRVHDASDSPGQTAQLVALGSRLSAFQNWQTNLASVKAEATAGDQAIGSGVSILEQARVLGVRGGNSTLSATDRQNLAAQVGSLQQQLVSLSNTNVQGRYIFGGDQDSSPPYTLNTLAPNGVSQLTAQTATRIVTDPDGAVVFQSSTAAGIFDQPSASAFQAIQDLQTALQTNNQLAIGAALQSLETASDWLNGKQAGYGTAENHLTESDTSASSEILSLQASISAIRDTDVAQAATDLTRESTQQQAAIAAQATISRKTLFDYLG